MKKTIFQIALIGGLIFFVVVAVFIFSGVIKTPTFGKKTNVEAKGKVILWGTIESSKMAPIMDALAKSNQTYSVSYVFVPRNNFENELIEALASSKGPDAIILDPGLLVKHANKLYTTSFKTVTERQYRDSYADAANLYLGPDGILAFPISIDPIVLFYNKDLLTEQAIVSPPEYWNQLTSLNKNFVRIDPASGSIQKSMIGFGEYDNVLHAKDIISLLALQLSNPIVRVQTETDNQDKIVYKYLSVFDQANQDGVRVGESVMRFYTQFSDPAKETYTWNKTFQSDLQAFLTGKTVFYIGYASEYNNISQKNPNLRFDIARIPQVKDSPIKKTYGNVLGLAVIKNTTNPNAAFAAVDLLTTDDYADIIAKSLGTAPAKRSLLSVKQQDAYGGIVYPSAIIADSWYDPNPAETGKIFRRMIVGIVSGNETVSSGVQDFVKNLQDVLP